MSEPAPYHVVLATSETARLKRGRDWAIDQGGPILADFTKTARTVHFRLGYEPLEWGEPRYRLHHLDMDVMFGTFLIFNVHYAVSEQKRIVYVQRILFVTSYPHGQPPADEPETPTP